MRRAALFILLPAAVRAGSHLPTMPAKSEDRPSIVDYPERLE